MVIIIATIIVQLYASSESTEFEDFIHSLIYSFILNIITLSICVFKFRLDLAHVGTRNSATGNSKQGLNNRRNNGKFNTTSGNHGSSDSGTAVVAGSSTINESQQVSNHRSSETLSGAAIVNFEKKIAVYEKEKARLSGWREHYQMKYNCRSILYCKR